MNKKIYDAIQKFIIFLSSAEESWQQNQKQTEVYYAQSKDLLTGIGMGKTDEEIVKRALIAAATIVTRQDLPEDYPTINFVNQK